MIGSILTNDKGEILAKPSLFQPGKVIAEFTGRIKADYQIGYDIMHRSYREFNDRTPLDMIDYGQKAYNAYREPASDDPDESWKWTGVRPITKNKIISIAAHTTAALIYPNVKAQNDQDDDDKDAANVMRDLIIYNIENSDYEMTFLHGVLAALSSPVAYLSAEYAEVLQQIKERNKQGKISIKEVVDEVFSGFQTNNIPADEILIANAYQYYLQRQRFVIRRRFIDYDEAKALHGDHMNFEYVQPGIKTLYAEQDGMFYDQVDDENPTLIEEVTYFNRTEDTEIPFLNGIYQGDNDVDANPIKHRDYQNRPKYNLAKFGYRPIDEKHFYFYASAADDLGDDQELVDEMWRLKMDGTYLSVMTPLAVTGSEEVNSSMIFPGGITSFRDDTTRVQPLIPAINVGAADSAIAAIEQSASETAQDDQQSGVDTPGTKTAYEVSKLEQNARVKLGLFGRMIAGAVKDLGYLMTDIVIQHQTVAEVEEITGGQTRMKFRTFLLPDQVEDGRKVSKKIIFTDTLDDEVEQMERDEQGRPLDFNLLKAQGGLKGDKSIYKVNPTRFAKLRFMLTVTPDQIGPKTEAFEKAIKLEGYDRMIENPLLDPESITRDFLVEVYAKGESDKYMKKAPAGMDMMMPEIESGKQTNLVDQATGSNSLPNLMRE